MDGLERQQFIREQRERAEREAKEAREALTQRLLSQPLEDPLQRWKREADESDRQREAARAQLRREEREAERARGADWWAAVDAHIERRLAEHQEQFAELAKASAEFSDKVLQALDRLARFFKPSTD